MVCSLHNSFYVSGAIDTSTGAPRASGGDGKRQHGRYVLGELLGRGGMAEVFAGFVMGSHGFQKPVAIKRLLPELANDTVFVERLIGEAKLLVGMQHGNVVSVLDLAREGDDVFLIMELVDGPSLRQLMKARGQRGLSLGAASYVIQAAAQGLQFAHARPGGAVIHADISPSNLLLTTSGEVRVADFGIARREGLLDGVVEGKWAYMAPEQARGEELTPAADVFALGVVMYELICGQHPLGRRITADERESRPLHVVPPRIVRASVPVGLDAICMRALAADPMDRYASMQELIDALVDERFAQGYREGASDLAAAIREVQLGHTAAAAATQQMDRPVTILTRSLLASGTQPQVRPSAELAAAMPAMMMPVGRLSASAPTAFAEGSEAFAPGSLPFAQPGAPRVPTQTAHAAPAATWWKYAAIGAAALVAGVVAAVVMMQPPAPLPPVDTMRPAPAAPVPVAVVAPVVIPTPVPAAAPPAPAPVAPTPEPTPAPAVVAAPVHKAAAKKTGVLQVTSSPWAYVVIDGVEKQTPVAKFTLSAGKHVVRLRNGETGATLAREVVIGAGESALVRVRGEDWP